MDITLNNCNAKLLTQGIDLSNGDNEKLTSQLQTMLTFEGWGYSFDSDKLVINNVPDGTTIPAILSNYGDVVQS